MKRILMGLMVSAAVLSSSAFLTKAVWTDTVTVTNNIIATGTVDLEVSTDWGANWNSTSAATSMVLSNLYPDGPSAEGYSYSLRNAGSVGPLGLTAQVTSTNIVPNPGVDKTQLMVQVYDINTGLPESAELTLAQWEAGTQALTSTLASGAARSYGVRARLLGTAANSWQGQTVTFTLSVVGTQPTP
jgi:hypothetical protein